MSIPWSGQNWKINEHGELLVSPDNGETWMLRSTAPKLKARVVLIDGRPVIDWYWEVVDHPGESPLPTHLRVGRQ